MERSGGYTSQRVVLVYSVHFHKVRLLRQEDCPASWMRKSAQMNFYKTIIEEISLENEQLLLFLGIPTLLPAPHLSEEQARRQGPSDILLLSERNRLLRRQIAAAFSTLNLDARLRGTSAH